MLRIDGSEGEGGGQIVRSSIALSVLTRTPIHIENIRLKRDKPGLRRQHLTAVEAAATLCDANVEGARLGSRALTFEPKAFKPGDYFFDIGTAGSTMLVLQTLLPCLMFGGGRSTLRLEGGTHNPGAPPFDFLDRVYLPIVRKMGARVDATLERPGFYPAGGGAVTVKIESIDKLNSLELHERGAIRSRSARAIVANLPLHIAERERDWILTKSGWMPAECTIEQWNTARGPGNVVLVDIESENITEVFVGFGQKGVRAEQVADQVWNEVDEYLASDVPVGHYLTDQLLLPCALAASGGSTSTFRSHELSLHATTHIQILRRFLKVQFDLETLIDGTINVSTRPE
jgi:RNA 3'-terminal phosphate cyclase (ATP)